MYPNYTQPKGEKYGQDPSERYKAGPGKAAGGQGSAPSLSKDSGRQSSDLSDQIEDQSPISPIHEKEDLSESKQLVRGLDKIRK